MRRAVQFFHTGDGDVVGAVAGDLGAHRAQAIGQIHHFRLARGVLQHGHAVSQRRRHHQVLGAGHADDIEEDARALEALGFGVDVAVFDGDLGAHRLQTLDVQIDRARADGTAAGQGHLGIAEARHQRPQHEDRRTHGLHHVVGRFPVIDLVALEGDFARRGFRRDAHLLQQFAHGADIVQVGQVGQAQGIGGQQAGAHDGQCGVLGAGDAHFAAQRVAALNC